MSNNNVFIEKKKALLAHKEKILAQIKNYEKNIEDFQENHKNNSYFEDVDSSDSEDYFPNAIDTGPTVPQLKLQQAMLKTCLQATQELTSLMVLQSEVNVLVEDPKLDGERPVTETGTWTEVTAECRIDLVPFTISFYMHKPDRKFAPPSYRGLQVVPVKYAHEMELAKSVLHTLKLPSDAIEVLKSYAAGYRSRRTTLARLSNKYAEALFMEPHSEGGFVLKCADLLEVSWRLENKWSPVAPFHHRMKFDLEYMDESFIKIITQAHKQLLDPTIQTDERTLLLAKIISTCLEAKGPVDSDTDLESKATERDNETEKRDGETEKRDSEVMAPPKSLPKKPKPKNKDNLPNHAQKRSMDDDNDDSGTKRMKNNVKPSVGPKRSNADSGINARKSKMSDVVDVGGKKNKINDGSNKNKDKVASNINKESGDTDNKNANSTAKNKTVEEKRNLENNKDGNTKPKNMKEPKKENEKGSNMKPKNTKESEKVEAKGSNIKPKSKTTKESVNTFNKDGNPESKNEKANANNEDVNKKGEKKVSNTKPKTITVKESENTEQDKVNGNSKDQNGKGSSNQDNASEEAGNPEDDKVNNISPKNIEKKKAKNKTIPKISENVNVTNKITKTKDAERQTNKPTENNVANTKKAENNLNKANIKPQTVESTKTNVAKAKIDGQVKKADKNTINKVNTKPEITNKGSKNIAIVKSANLNSKGEKTVKKVTEKHANNIKIKDKISPISSKDSDINVKEKGTTDIIKNTVPEKVINANTVANNKIKEIINNNNVNKTMKNMPHRLSTHRKALKATNSQKTIKPGNTNVLNSGNAEKENGGSKITKIPQKILTPISESSVRKNPLRISPRSMPKFKSSPQTNTFKQKMMKSTNIPRLLKKPAPKATQ